MPEVVIKYKNAKSLKALHDLAEAFDMVIEKPESKKKRHYWFTYKVCR